MEAVAVVHRALLRGFVGDVSAAWLVDIVIASVSEAIQGDVEFFRFWMASLRSQ
jgi:hypothetical protein